MGMGLSVNDRNRTTICCNDRKSELGLDTIGADCLAVEAIQESGKIYKANEAKRELVSGYSSGGPKNRKISSSVPSGPANRVSMTSPILDLP